MMRRSPLAAALGLLALLALAGCGATPGQVSKPAPPLPPGTGAPGTDAPPASAVFNDDVGENPLKITMIDIGQGDSIFIEAPGGKRVLIDTGPSSGKDALLGWLDAHQISRIDLLIDSHAHADHIANSWRVVQSRDIGMVLDSGMAHTARDYVKLLDAVERKGIPFKVARRGRVIDLGGGARLTVLAPEDPLVKGSRSDLNANSVVVRLDFGEISALFTGDAEHETENRLLAHTPNELGATILKVAHHGSRHATQDAFLKAVSPRLALISCAERNRYRHPAPETLERLAKAGIPVFETRRHGNITISTDGKGLRVETSQGGPPTVAVVAAPPADPGEVEAPEEEALPVVLLNVNTATAEELIALPGIGKVTAGRIIDYRTKNGPFQSVEDLRKVSGIGAKTMDRLRPLVTVRSAGG
ncbi:MAG: helix-hairpin-helix domain-containing protein [bacterium]